MVIYYAFQTFQESFTIKSGGRTLKSRMNTDYADQYGCYGFHSDRITYDANGHRWSGIASATVSRGSFIESFQ